MKICPQQAIEIRAYADFAPLGGSVIPMMASKSIMWTIKFRNGNVKRFKFPIRTVAAGAVDIYSDAAKADIAKIKHPGFYSHHARGDALPVPARPCRRRAGRQPEASHPIRPPYFSRQKRAMEPKVNNWEFLQEARNRRP